ncbi:MAG: polysaccharide pyruvyl transferase family protein [Cyanobacteria bacterium P01_F01_bin.53]
MKLFYYKTTTPSQNFGDELNPWLWPRLISDFDENKKDVFIGIGTVLNDQTPQWVNEAKNAIFFSTGVGYGRSFRLQKKPNWRIYCVRGPLSAKKLKLPAPLAITDGAALLKRYFDPIAVAERAYAVSYMPHFRHGSPQRFKTVCQRVGIHFIDPAGEVENVITQIAQSKVLISEAMHGAIVADTLRVPWIPVRTSPKILPFKWRDWCASVNLPYRGTIIRGAKPLSRRDYRYPLRPYLQGQASIVSLFDGVRMSDFSGPLVEGSVIRGAKNSEPTTKHISERTLDRLSVQLEKTTRKPSFLSDETHQESLVMRLEERLDVLKKDIRKGVFA